MPTTTTASAVPGHAAAPRVSVEEFVAHHNGDHVELVKGVVKEMPVPGLEHGKICARLTMLIGIHVEANELGQVMSNDSFVRTGADTVRGADVLYYSYERLPKGQPVPEGVHVLVPDLVVEVKSPTERWVDVFAKIVEYLQAGVRVAVLVDPGRSTVSVYRDDQQDILKVGEELALPDVLPGFAVPVGRLFA
jgi:Uma2 family endonuclease